MVTHAQIDIKPRRGADPVHLSFQQSLKGLNMVGKWRIRLGPVATTSNAGIFASSQGVRVRLGAHLIFKGPNAR